MNGNQTTRDRGVLLQIPEVFGVPVEPSVRPFNGTRDVVKDITIVRLTNHSAFTNRTCIGRPIRGREFQRLITRHPVRLRCRDGSRKITDSQSETRPPSDEGFCDAFLLDGHLRAVRTSGLFPRAVAMRGRPVGNADCDGCHGNSAPPSAPGHSYSGI
jgi:hypothetical protein